MMRNDDFTREEETKRNDETAETSTTSDKKSFLRWVEMKNDLAAVACDASTLDLLQSAFEEGVRDKAVLTSLAKLSPRQDKDDASYSTLARYWTSDWPRPAVKLASLRVLLQLHSPAHAKWQWADGIVQDTLDFLITPEVDEFPYPEHSLQTLVWELRARCLHLLEQKHEQAKRIQQRAEVCAHWIYNGARILESGLSHSTQLLTTGIDQTGHVIKHCMGEPAKEPPTLDSSQVVTLTYTNAAKRATDRARETTQRAVTSVRDVSSQGLQAAMEQLQETQLVETLVPDAQNRTLLSAAGQVGLASLGAAAVLGEAMLEATQTVAQTTANVTADVVQHKYGSAAGQLVRDTSDTAGNIFRTTACVAMMETQILAKAVAKNTGKRHCERQMSRRESNVSMEDSSSSEQCEDPHKKETNQQNIMGPTATQQTGKLPDGNETDETGSDSDDGEPVKLSVSR